MLTVDHRKAMQELTARVEEFFHIPAAIQLMPLFVDDAKRSNKVSLAYNKKRC